MSVIEIGKYVPSLSSFNPFATEPGRPNILSQNVEIEPNVQSNAIQIGRYVYLASYICDLFSQNEAEVAQH